MNQTLALLILLPATLLGIGCSNATEGALSGAGVGALSGLAIGSLSGDAGAGAAIGAVVGGVGGAVIGDQNKRRDDAAAAQQQSQAQAVAYSTPPTPQNYSTGQALGRLVGQWRITGTIDAGGGKTLPVSGTATGTVERTYFVRLDLHFTDPRSGQAVDGTGMVSQTGGRGIELTNSFSTSPELRQYKGTMDQSGTIISLSQFDPPAASRRVTIRSSAGRAWTAEVWDGNARVESYTFSPA
jgi:hypothetical protein